MRNNRNISPRQDGTLKSVVILNFRRTQSVDNQCLFFCQNVTSFTGKEKDSETGFYYFGARYYDPVLSGLFISVDPMADKYPGQSPYAYCTWNPVKLIDPTGMDTIYSFATKLQDANKNAENTEILKWMRDEGDTPGMVTLSMHGSPDQVEISVCDGLTTTLCDAKNLANKIKSMDLPDYKKNKKTDQTTIFLLYCCSTGNGDNSIAEQLSWELQEITIAPQGTLLVGNDNHTMTNTISKTDKTVQPWNVYYRGRKVMDFQGLSPKEWINNMGGINNTAEKIKEIDRKSHPWE